MTYYLSPSFLARSTVATELENWFKEIINRCSTGVKSSNALLSHFQTTIMRNIIFLITKAILFITELMSALYCKVSLIPSHYSNSTATDVILFMAFAQPYSSVRTVPTQLVPGSSIDYTTSYHPPMELIQCVLAVPHSMRHQDSTNQSYNLSDIGPHPHGKFTSKTTPPSEPLSN